MARLDTKTIVEKADLAVSDLISDGGYLNPMQANTFIRMVQDQPTIINSMRVVPMNAPTMEINKIGFADRILRVAPSSGTALADELRAKPTTDQVTLTTKEIMAEVHITYDTLEDNIERGRLESTIMSMISERAAIDLEELIIRGYHSATDPYLAVLDGLLIQAKDHIVTYSTPPTTYDVNIFKAGIHAIPQKYIRNRSAFKFYVSHYVETEFAAQQATRETILGDTRIAADYSNSLKAFGVPVVPCALMPDANYIFTHPQNLILGIQRRIQIETDKDIRKRIYIIVLTMRLDFVIEEPDAVVKCTGLTATGTTTY